MFHLRKGPVQGCITEAIKEKKNVAGFEPTTSWSCDERSTAALQRMTEFLKITRGRRKSHLCQIKQLLYSQIEFAERWVFRKPEFPEEKGIAVRFGLNLFKIWFLSFLLPMNLKVRNCCFWLFWAFKLVLPLAVQTRLNFIFKGNLCSFSS